MKKTEVGDTMSVPDSKKRANAKWDKQNMLTIGCRLRREHAEQFKQLAAENGKTANEMLRDYIMQQISQQQPKP